jgi:hypothetical protein
MMLSRVEGCNGMFHAATNGEVEAWDKAGAKLDATKRVDSEAIPDSEAARLRGREAVLRLLEKCPYSTGGLQRELQKRHQGCRKDTLLLVALSWRRKGESSGEAGRRASGIWCRTSARYRSTKSRANLHRSLGHDRGRTLRLD